MKLDEIYKCFGEWLKEKPHRKIKLIGGDSLYSSFENKILVVKYYSYAGKYIFEDQTEYSIDHFDDNGNIIFIYSLFEEIIKDLSDQQRAILLTSNNPLLRYIGGKNDN